MTEVLYSLSNLPSLPSSFLPCAANDCPRQSRALLSPGAPTAVEGEGGGKRAGSSGRKKKGAQGRRRRDCRRKRETDQEEQFSFLALLVAVVRRSLIGCTTENEEGIREAMEIGRPTNVRHVAHVTFDRFHGFLGLPVEFEPDVPRRAPSASASVFGVSTESMQCSYDSRGNSIPTILILMQRHLYEQGGLQAEGIFRINAENSEEEQVREQLNGGVVPDDIDVHCLAGLIKAWFRELPSGVLDPLTPEQVMQCQTEDECAQLVKLLPPTEAALLDWAINLMADVVQEEEHNKMNARNLATVFAPNMTQMADPLSALMYAVKVMNFLQTLILVTLRERREPPGETGCLRPRRDLGTHGDDDTERAETPGRPSEGNSAGDDRCTSSNGGKVALEGSTGEASPSANDLDAAAAAPDVRAIGSSDMPGAAGKKEGTPQEKDPGVAASSPPVV